MAYKITNEEKETIIVFNELSGLADISTFNGALIRKITALCESRPGEAFDKTEHPEGCRNFVVPKTWIKVNAGPVISKERTKALRDGAKHLRDGNARAKKV